MVVAHVLSSLRIGGQERVALDLASGQVEAGHSVLVVSLAPASDSPLAAAFEARGVGVRTEPKRVGLDPTLSLRLARLFRRERPTVVHTHNRVPLIYAAAPARVAGARVVHTRHGPGRGSGGERWLRRAAGQFLNAYVAVTPELETLARELGDCHPGKLSVIENGIDLARFTPAPDARAAARAALGLPENAWVVGSVGRLAPEKDYPLFVRAAAPLLGPDARLLIVGGGSEAEAIRAEANRAGVGAFVTLPGPRDDVPSALAAMDAFALSSKLEGLPLSVLEAMAVKLPVVVPAIGGLPTLIRDGETGLLFPAGDATALGRHLGGLRADPARARTIAAAGQAYVHQRHSREAMVRRYLDLYTRVGARS
jgi:glycosyltransferase involved in cell wall biosynthesis